MCQSNYNNQKCTATNNFYYILAWLLSLGHTFLEAILIKKLYIGKTTTFFVWCYFLKNEAMSFYCCKCFRPKKNKIGIAKALADTSKLARLVQIEVGIVSLPIHFPNLLVHNIKCNNIQGMFKDKIMNNRINF